jgi:hypothetical protein
MRRILDNVLAKKALVEDGKDIQSFSSSSELEGD